MKIEIEVGDPPEGMEWRPEEVTVAYTGETFAIIRLPFGKSRTYTDHLKAAGWPVGGVWPFAFDWASANRFGRWFTCGEAMSLRDELWCCEMDAPLLSCNAVNPACGLHRRSSSA